MRETNRKLTVVALLFAVFLAAMEATAVATVMPTIVGDLGGLEHYAWVFTAYMMISTVSVPIYGKISDIFGRKPVLQFGIFIFLIGSLLSALSKNMTGLIIFRAIQGLGAGAIQPMGLTITGDIFSIKERAKITAIFGTVWGVAGIAGPLIGSLIVEILGWPWIFYINLPFGIIAAWIIQFSLVEHPPEKKVSLDWLGAIFLASTIITVLVAVNDPAEMFILVPLSTILFIAFLLTEQRAEDPIVSLSLFSHPVISNASLVSLMLGGAMLSFVSYLPLHVEGVRKLSIYQAGMCIIPMGIGWPVASALSAKILPKIGFRPLLRMGLLFVCSGCALTAYTTIEKLPFPLLLLGMGLLGLGMGFSNIPLLFSIQNAVAWNQRGIVTASNLFCRAIGGTVAVGVMGGILTKALKKGVDVPENAANELMGPLHGRNLSPDVLEKIGILIDKGLNKVFLYAACISALALLFGYFFPEIGKTVEPVKESEG